MAWIIQSISDGPVLINDLGNMTLHKNQMRDLDLIGRTVAERSNDLKVLIAKGFIVTISKDAGPASTTVDPAVITELKNATAAAQAASKAQAEVIDSLQKEAQVQEKQNKALLTKMDAILEAVLQYQEQHPKEIKILKTALENIKTERANIKIQKEELPLNVGISEEEIATQTKLLDIKDKKLEKNCQNLGDSIIKGIPDANINDALDAMDDVGIG